MREEEYPALETCLETYFKALEYFNVGVRFNTYELALKTARTESKAVIEKYSLQYYSHLYRLAMYGITAFHGASTFEIKLGPRDPQEKWEKRLGERGISLYKEVQKIRKIGIPTLEEFTRKGKKEVYLPSFVGAGPIEAIVTYVYNEYDPKIHDGIRVESRGRWNIKARRAAEEIIKKLDFLKLEIKDVRKTKETHPETGEEVTKQEIVLKPKD